MSNYRQQMEMLAAESSLADTLTTDQIAILSDHDLHRRLTQMSITIPQTVLDAMSMASVKRHESLTSAASALARSTALLTTAGGGARAAANAAASAVAPAPAPGSCSSSSSSSATLSTTTSHGGVLSASGSEMMKSSPLLMRVPTAPSALSTGATTAGSAGNSSSSSSTLRNGNVSSQCAAIHERFTSEMKRYSQQVLVAKDLASFQHKTHVIQEYYECVKRTHRYLSELCEQLNQLVGQLATEHHRLTQFEDERILQPQLGDELFYTQLQAERDGRQKQLMDIHQLFVNQQPPQPAS